MEPIAMKLTGLHLLLTYKCTFECDHCFVWSSPWQHGTMTVARIEEILRQARDLGTVDWIYFEGGEPSLFYPVLLRGARAASSMGFRVGVVTNAYWSTAAEDAEEWLRPFVGVLDDLSISNDTYHGGDAETENAVRAERAALKLGIPAATIRIARPESEWVAGARGQIPPGEYGVRFRGRAAEKLAPKAPSRPAEEMTSCPFEDLRDPGRIHVDPFGHLHVCQGISIGNIFERPIREIRNDYDPDAHPIVGPLLSGGPVALAESLGSSCGSLFADECHMCYETRRLARERFPSLLAPDGVYGVEP
jgi:MoaA/NifB/PqqE/SkfB family radical SAM enzyme